VIALTEFLLVSELHKLPCSVLFLCLFVCVVSYFLSLLDNDVSM
jgi:hypothetical protein